MSIRTKQILKLLIRIAVTAALLTWVFSKVDLQQFRQTVRAARWHYLIGVWLATVAFFAVQSCVMHGVLKRQDCHVPRRTLFAASCITALYSMILPGVLSAGVKWYILKRHTGKGSNVLSSMLYNQVTLSVVMVLVGLIGLIVTNPTHALFPEAQRQWVLPFVCGVVLVLIVLISALVLNHRTGRPATRLLAAAFRPLPAALRDKADRLLEQIAVFQRAGLSFHLKVALVNAFDSGAIGLLIYLCAARAAYVEVSLGVLIWLCAIVYVLGRLPISVANLGVREVTLVGLLTTYGVGRPAALLMSMILFSALVFMAALGVACQLLWLARSRH